ncbi:hypothetical protein MTR67_045162 [Solanum verrucosum]|uniref:Uncharacterized protein n=1 Tax=Solanum verrucosum TaxID=315347 RepID=A0AAF0UST8_SOLVR|nr:hypothetical protein MTR67_045162 [Solanum verrucosum]
MLLDVLMISSQVQGPGPLQSMNTHPVVKMLYCCNNYPCQGVGESAEYFTNQKRRGRGFTPLSKEVST